MQVTRAVRVAVASLAISVCGLGFISKEEGTHQRAYLDSIGVPTVCTGHTGNVNMSKWYTVAECEQLLRTDTDSAASQVRRLVKVPLYQHEFDALVSFCFNVGNGNCRSASLFKLLNNGDYNAVPGQLLRWRYAGGLDCKIRANNCYGVYLRRVHEGSLWKGEYQ